MNMTAHPVAPEEVMAYLDGELCASAARAVSVHLEHCAECSELANQFRATSQLLKGWVVPPMPTELEGSIENLAADTPSRSGGFEPKAPLRAARWHPGKWAIGCGLAAAAVLLVLAVSSQFPSRKFAEAAKPYVASSRAAEDGGPPLTDMLASRDAMPSAVTAGAASRPQVPPIAGEQEGDRAPAIAAPMIARTVSLTLVVKDVTASRASLDLILERHHGHAAQINALTPEGSPRSFSASLRVPASELNSALVELRHLGYVSTESQSGEEVTQQHIDLAARLETARETEERFRGILQQRTGTLADILQVEESIARVRGQIESMEVEQTTLEHRVSFASIDLQLTEVYKEQLSAAGEPVATRMHNASVTGLRNAWGTLLGVVLLLEEYGPTILIWLVILGLPVLVWWRYRRGRPGV